MSTSPASMPGATAPANATTADDLIRLLGMQPHPEGGHYAETWRGGNIGGHGEGGRAAGSAIYFLLRAGERSHWHRVTDAAECWHYYGGAPLQLSMAAAAASAAETSAGVSAAAEYEAAAAGEVTRQVLGLDVVGGQRPQLVVPAGWWQAAEPLGDWTLVGCTVSPAFEFSRFVLAPPGWKPTGEGGKGVRES
ncbi:hypothetical protein HK405_007966 [Cladochytrium tenue]|nr:hypothetical protein HK405_007966 [Cladochytrium tenue]